MLGLEELEGLDEQLGVVPVDRAVVAQAEVFEHDAREQHVLHARLDLLRDLLGKFAAEHLDEMRRLLVQVRVGRMGGDLVEVRRDGAHVLGDGPFVVVEHDDEFLRGLGHVVQRLVAHAAGEAASPAMQTTCSSEPRRSRPTAMPSAALSAVPAWPAP